MRRRERFVLGLHFLAEAADLVPATLGLALYPARPLLIAAGVMLVVSVLALRLSKNGWFPC